MVKACDILLSCQANYGVIAVDSILDFQRLTEDGGGFSRINHWMNSHFPVQFVFIPRKCNIIYNEFINLAFRHNLCCTWSPSRDDPVNILYVPCNVFIHG